MKSNKLLHSLPLLLGTAVLGACGPRTSADSSASSAQETARPDTMATVSALEAAHSVAFTPGPAGANVTGTVLITGESNGDTRLEVDLNGLAQGAHAWHVHQAGCDADGPIVLAITDTETLKGIGAAITPDANGHATADVTIPADKLSQQQLHDGQYSLHVHERDGTNPGQTVVCAPIR